MHWLWFSLSASVMGVLASMVTKIAITPSPLILSLSSSLCTHLTPLSYSPIIEFDKCVVVIRWIQSGGLIGVQLALNAVMLNSLVRAMHGGGTVRATTANQAIGFMLSVAIYIIEYNII